MSTKTMTKRGRRSSTNDEEEVVRAVPVTDLPSEVIEEIFSWVPTKPLAQFRCVNKHFFSLLTSNPDFSDKQITHTVQNKNQDDDETNHSLILQTNNPIQFYYIPNKDFERATKLEASYVGENPYIVSSSNGLICLHGSKFFPYHLVISFSLWNPATNQHKKLPEFSIDKFNKLTAMGFGFHPTLNDYKVVIIVPYFDINLHDDGRPTGTFTFKERAEVYSLNRNCWKTVTEDFLYKVASVISRAVVNGCVHWLAIYRYSGYRYEIILSFDMAGDVFRVLPMPVESKLPSYEGTYLLRVLRGKLSMFVVPMGENIDVWTMEKYGEGASWNKIITVEYKMPIGPICFLNDDDILFQTCPFKLVSYNSKTKTVKDLPTPEHENRPHMDVITYGETLVQLSADHGQTGGGQ